MVGRWNVSNPTEQQVTDGPFNNWIVRKRLVSISEIYSGEKRKAYDRLKSVITDETVRVNEKFVAEYSISNFGHVIACSNSIKAIYIDAADRRFFIPRVNEKVSSRDYWTGFYSWLNSGGLSIIADWAARYASVPGNVVKTGDRPPETSAKLEAVRESRSEGQRLAIDLAEAALAAATEKGEPVVLAVDDVRSWVAGRRELKLGDVRLESMLTLRKALREGGLKEPEGTETGRDIRLRTPVGNRYVVSTAPFEHGANWKSIMGWHIQPRDLLPDSM